MVGHREMALARMEPLMLRLTWMAAAFGIYSYRVNRLWRIDACLAVSSPYCLGGRTPSKGPNTTDTHAKTHMHNVDSRQQLSYTCRMDDDYISSNILYMPSGWSAVARVKPSAFTHTDWQSRQPTIHSHSWDRRMTRPNRHRYVIRTLCMYCMWRVHVYHPPRKPPPQLHGPQMEINIVSNGKMRATEFSCIPTIGRWWRASRILSVSTNFLPNIQFSSNTVYIRKAPRVLPFRFGRFCVFPV